MKPLLTPVCSQGRIRRAMLLAILGCYRVAPADEPAGGEDLGVVYEQVRRASVEILVDDKHAGSGWFADEKGLVFTAAHVVAEPGRRVELLTAVAGRISARPVAVDFGHDLALLEAEATDVKFPALRLRERKLRPGEELFLFGAPLYRSAVMLPGRVARAEPTFEYLPTGWHIRCLHVAAIAPPGTSGGPWFDRSGRVVGLQSGAVTIGAANQGIAYLIPADAIVALLETRRSAATPTLGAAVEETWQQDREFLRKLPAGFEGLVVRRLADGGPAAKAGIATGDVIRAIDGQPVRRREELLADIRRRRPAETVRMTVFRPGTGETREFVVELQKLEIDFPDK